MWNPRTERVPKKGQIWTGDLFPKAEFRPHWRRWAWRQRSLLVCVDQSCSPVAGQGRKPPSGAQACCSLWPALLAQLEYWWATARSLGCEHAEEVEVAMGAWAALFYVKKEAANDHQAGLERQRGGESRIHLGSCLGQRTVLCSHTHSSHWLCKRCNRRSPSSCQVLAVPSTEKAELHAHCKEELLPGSPSFVHSITDIGG